MKKHGFVYFITSQDSGLTKVGFSFDPAKRLKQLQTGHGSKLRIPMQIKTKNPRALEARLHLLFKHKRQAGEWFRLDQEDFDLITREFSEEGGLAETIASAIRDCFISPNVCDSNLEPANIVDVMQNVARALDGIRHQNEAISKKIYESALLISGTSSKTGSQDLPKLYKSFDLSAATHFPGFLLALLNEFNKAWDQFLGNCGMTLAAGLVSSRPELIEPFPKDARDQAHILLVFPQRAVKDMEFVKSRCLRLLDFGIGISSRKWVFYIKLDGTLDHEFLPIDQGILQENPTEKMLEKLRQSASRTGGASA